MTSSKMAISTNETCYINLLHQDILANILSRLPEPTSIVHSVLACKPWCHVINVHGILRRHRPPTICGVLRENVESRSGKHSLIFTPTDQMASPDLVEVTNNIPDEFAESLPGGPWYIADSHEGFFLLVRYHRSRIGSKRTRRVLAIFNPVTSDLQELPPVAYNLHWFFVGAAILPDVAGNGSCLLTRGSSDVLTFKVVCVVGVGYSFPGDGSDECIMHTLVHSTVPGDKWSHLRSTGGTCWSISNLSVLFSNLSVRVPRREARSIASSHLADSVPLMMLYIRTGRTFLMLPQAVSRVIPYNCTFAEYGRGDDDKLWFVCIHDTLMLRLYSHRKPPNDCQIMLQRGDWWSPQREVQLRPQIEDLTNDLAGELHLRNVHSRNGYVFFAIDNYGYFVVHLRSMHVQRLSGVPETYYIWASLSLPVASKFVILWHSCGAWRW